MILAFYILAFTPGSKQELQAYQSNLAKIEASDTVFSESAQTAHPPTPHLPSRLTLPFPLLSDMNRKVLTDYGILQKYPWPATNMNLRVAPLCDRQERRHQKYPIR